MSLNIILFVVALKAFLPFVSLSPIAGINEAQPLDYERSIKDSVQRGNPSPDAENVSNLGARDLTNLFDFARALAPTQSFQLDNFGPSGDQNSAYYRILLTFLDLLTTCTRLTRDKLIQWRLGESKDRNELEFLKKLQNESPGRVVFPDQLAIPNSNSGHGTLWTTGRKLPLFLPTINSNAIDIRR